MPVTHYRFIRPATLAAIRDLTLVARTVVDGVMYGVHPSRMPGAGLEFSQYRSYQAGDDLRRVDWKLYGRSDRYFVREAETETSLTLRIAVDASASMAHEEGISKMQYARFLAAALALLAHRQGDAVGLFGLSDGDLLAVRPGRGQAHLDRVMHAIERLKPAGVWPPWDRVERALSIGGGRGITVLITDLHERSDEIRSALGKLAAMGHDAILMHLLGRQELELGYDGPVALEELETGRVVEINPATERAAYVAAVDGEHRALRHTLAGHRIDYCRFALDEPLDGALRTFLASRRRAAGAV